MPATTTSASSAESKTDMLSMNTILTVDYIRVVTLTAINSRGRIAGVVQDDQLGREALALAGEMAGTDCWAALYAFGCELKDGEAWRIAGPLPESTYRSYECPECDGDGSIGVRRAGLPPWAEYSDDIVWRDCEDCAGEGYYEIEIDCFGQEVG